MFQPNVVVLQGDSDSLSEDQLGCFDLTIKLYAMCVESVKSFNQSVLTLERVLDILNVCGPGHREP